MITIKRVHFFVEGSADLYALRNILHAKYKAYIEPLSDKKNEWAVKTPNILGRITYIGGWNQLEQPINISTLKNNNIDDVLNIVIFDADFTSTQQIHNGYIARKKCLEGWKLKHQVDFEFFLLPNNNDDGLLEDLLLQMVQQDYQSISDCIQTYYQCLQNAVKGLNVKTHLPTKERKNMLLQIIKKKQEDYFDGVADVEHLALIPLLTFLQQHLPLE